MTTWRWGSPTAESSPAEGSSYWVPTDSLPASRGTRGWTFRGGVVAWWAPWGPAPSCARCGRRNWRVWPTCSSHLVSFVRRPFRVRWRILQSIGARDELTIRRRGRDRARARSRTPRCRSRSLRAAEERDPGDTPWHSTVAQSRQSRDLRESTAAATPVPPTATRHARAATGQRRVRRRRGDAGSRAVPREIRLTGGAHPLH